jgi:hypothetical protein
MDDEDNEKTVPGKLGEDNKRCWMMGTITKTVPQGKEWFRLQPVELDQLTQHGWQDAADCFCGR